MIQLVKRRVEMKKIEDTKIRVFGQKIDVNVKYTKTQNPELNLEDNVINIYLPNKYKKVGNTEILKLALKKMYDEIARIEIEKVMEETRLLLNGLAPESFEIRRMNNKYATCLKDKTIVINPDIVKFDKNVLRYVVLHEFCHLKYKSHAKGFFNMMEKYMPDYARYEYMLNVA